MFFDTVLVDLDDTLYNYQEVHQTALAATLKAMASEHMLDLAALARHYTEICHALKSELGMTAASHNRFIYFKQLCHAEGISLGQVASYNRLYWKIFYATMRPAPGALKLLTDLRKQKVRVGVLTDFQIEHQFEKLQCLGMLDLVDDVISSEEVGVEKPNSKMFLTALSRLNARAERTVMIGDSFDKDMLGAARCGIESFWITPSTPSQTHPKCTVFSSLSALHAWWQEMSESVDELVRLSRYCGLRFDLTQAAGGNISVKCGPHMLIKSSGFHLADVDAAQGYSIVDNQRLQADLSAGIATSLEPYVQFSSKRPSIETFMHASLGRFTVHLHPIQVNAVLTAQGAREKLSRIWPDSHIVDYVRPGIDLAIAVQSNGASEQVTFLLNHGVIFSTQDAAAILPLIEKTLARFTEFAIIDSAQHQRVNPISNLLERLLGEACAVYLCEDAQIRAHFDGLNDLRATFPDAVVYCGTQVLRMAKVDETNMQRHIETFGMPKLIVVDNSLYIADLSLKKCRDVEAVLKSLLLLQDPLQPRALLSDVEVSFLNQWDAEKYRRELKH